MAEDVIVLFLSALVKVIPILFAFIRERRESGGQIVVYNYKKKLNKNYVCSLTSFGRGVKVRGPAENETKKNPLDSYEGGVQEKLLRSKRPPHTMQRHCTGNVKKGPAYIKKYQSTARNDRHHHTRKCHRRYGSELNVCESNKKAPNTVNLSLSFLRCIGNQR